MKKNLKYGFLKFNFFLIFIFTSTLINISFSLDNPSYKRIISLGPRLTEEIFLLDAGDKLIADTVYCIRPEEAKKKEKIGNVIELNVEKALSLKPDIVLATDLAIPGDLEILKRAGIHVELFDQPKSYRGILDEFLKLGKLTGNNDKAKKIAGESLKRVENIKNRASQLSKKKVFLQIGTNPLYTITKDSFMNDFIEYTGGINIALNAASGRYSREKVVESNPDIIIIAAMGIEAENEKKEWMAYKTLNAARNNQIFIIDQYTSCSPTPVTFADTLEEIAKMLRPDNFVSVEIPSGAGRNE